MVFLLFWLVAFVINVNGIIVDDTSDIILYSNNPAWNGGTASQPTNVIEWPGNDRGSTYGGTWHESLYTRSSARFTFTGTAISVYGIVANTQLVTRIGFSMDGGGEAFYDKQPASATVVIQQPEHLDYGVQVFTTQGLSPSSHTLVFTVYGQTAFFGLDYIEYTPAEVATTTSASAQSSSSSSSQNTTNAQVTGVTTMNPTISSFVNGLPPISISAPNTDTTSDLPTILPSDPRIVYSSPQQWIGNTSCGMSSIVTASSGAFFSFSFTGSSLWIYTAMNPQGGSYEVSIDGNIKGFFNTAGSACKVQALYRVDNLDSSTHTLVVTNANTGGSTNSSGVIDFLGFRLANLENQSAVPTAAVVGGVLGGVAVLALLVFLVYWGFLRKRRNSRSKEEPMATERAQPFPSPQEPYTASLPEKQRLAAFESAAQRSGQNDRMAYQTYLKPDLPGWTRSPFHQSTGGNEDTPGSYPNNISNPQDEEVRSIHSTAPPSFRTRPVTAQYGRINYPPSVGSRGSLEIGSVDVAQSSARSLDGGEWGTEQSHSAPPYVEDVLARPDARNLSESDVDMIARRLAGVMRINNAARGGPGLLRGAPPRELIDQLVEDHLAAREDLS